MVSAVLALGPAESFSGDSDTISAISEYPPYETRAVRLLNYVNELSVLRHRTIALDLDRIVEVLESSMAESRSSEEIIFPLFDDASFVVRFTDVRKHAYGWIALFEGVEQSQSADQKTTVRGDLSITSKTGELTASFGWDRRQFAVHFTGDPPFHLVVENDPAERPNID